MTVLTSLFPFILIVLTGFVVGGKKIFPENFPTLINKFLFLVAIPIFFFGSFNDLDEGEVVNFLPFIMINILICASLYLLLYFSLTRTKIKKESISAVLTPSFIGNSIYFGFPVLLALFSPDHINYAVIYVAFVTVVDFVGIFLISNLTGKNFKLRDQLVNFAKTPILIATFFGIALLILGVPIPETVLEVTESFGSVLSPLIMFAFGMYFSQNLKFGEIQLSFLASFNKLLLLPLVTYLVVHYIFPLPTVAAQTSVILACMPSAFFNLVIADNYGVDKEVTLSSIMLSSILFFITSIFWINLVQ